MIVQSYKTLFENHTENMIKIFENGKILNMLSPYCKMTLESISALTDYARYSLVKWMGSGILPILEVRENWKEPDHGKWVTKFVNIDGKELEERDIGNGQKVHLAIGIPIVRAVPLGSRYIFAKRVEIRLCFEKRDSFSFPGYLSTYQELRDVFEFRTDEEKEQILQELKAVEQPQKSVQQAEQKLESRGKQL